MWAANTSAYCNTFYLQNDNDYYGIVITAKKWLFILSIFLLKCSIPLLFPQIKGKKLIFILLSVVFSNQKKILQDLNGVYVYNAAERENLDRPTARLVKEFACIEELFFGLSMPSPDTTPMVI
ncbi:hypothetical protein MKW98_025250 [Papaver atlanticum]|uniref:Uncharacterized protein n=1 Tax=Papaver atlanticum TaxID=357466 RepID=A0AAD4X6A2_9MAGN|nr:hypothetical protein MKW98_025250 [Papaver atlanticum]